MKSVKQLTFNPAWLNRWPRVLRSPQGIAVVASLGLHGALFAAGPSFSRLQDGPISSNSFDEAERRVPLVELTAEEQSRLPNFNRTSAYPWLPEGDTDFLSMLPPPTSLGNIPSNGGSGLSSTPDISIPRTSRPSPGRPSPLGRSSASPFGLGQGSSIISIPAPGGAARPGTPIPGDPSAAAGGSNNGGSTAENSTAESSTAEAEGANRDGESNGSGTSREPSAADLDLTLGPRPSPEAAPSGNGDASEPTRSATPIARMEHSDERTTDAEAESAQNTWIASMAEELGQPELTVAETFAITIPYEQRICLNPSPSEGLLGLTVLPAEDGTATLSTTVLRSTGYPFLNTAAQQALQAQLVESDVVLEPGALYRAVVQIDYDPENCVSHETLLKSRLEEVEAAEEGVAPGNGAAESAPLDGE